MRLQFSAGLASALLLSACAIAPSPLTVDELTQNAQAQQAALQNSQEPVAGPISLDEAIARAIRSNRDHRVEMLSASVAIANLELAGWDMLPKVVASSNYFGRDNDQGSRSRSLISGRQSLEYSTSSDREHFLSDLTFSYNILDFGLSYIRALQAADKALIAEEQRRKAALRIVEDTRTAYWRAVSAERLVERMRTLEADVQRAMRNTRSLSSEGMASPLPALTYERELVSIKRELQQLERNLTVAKQQLAALMNILPGTSFRLVVPAQRPVPLIQNARVEHLVDHALQNRPEVRQIIYETKIAGRDATAALLELLPGVQVFTGASRDTNSFMWKGDWLSWGAKASWNALRLFTYPAMRRQHEGKEELNRQRALAMAVAVITQVHVTRARYLGLTREFRTAQDYVSVQRRILNQVRAESVAQRGTDQNLIRERMNLLVAEAKHDIAYADLQNAYGNFLASIGVDLVDPATAANLPLADLSRRIATVLAGAESLKFASAAQ